MVRWAVIWRRRLRVPSAVVVILVVGIVVVVKCVVVLLIPVLLIVPVRGKRHDGHDGVFDTDWEANGHFLQRLGLGVEAFDVVQAVELLVPLVEVSPAVVVFVLSPTHQVNLVIADDRRGPGDIQFHLDGCPLVRARVVVLRVGDVGRVAAVVIVVSVELHPSEHEDTVRSAGHRVFASLVQHRSLLNPLLQNHIIFVKLLRAIFSVFLHQHATGHVSMVLVRTPSKADERTGEVRPQFPRILLDRVNLSGTKTFLCIILPTSHNNGFLVQECGVKLPGHHHVGHLLAPQFDRVEAPHGVGHVLLVVGAAVGFAHGVVAAGRVRVNPAGDEEVVVEADGGAAILVRVAQRLHVVIDAVLLALRVFKRHDHRRRHEQLRVVPLPADHNQPRLRVPDRKKTRS